MLSCVSPEPEERGGRRALGISVLLVVHCWDAQVLRESLLSLEAALVRAEADGRLREGTLHLYHNGSEPRQRLPVLAAQVRRWLPRTSHLHMGQPNRGYAHGNNALLRAALSVQGNDVIVVMNPDVFLEEDALTRALARLEEVPVHGLVCPRILDRGGAVDMWGCKRYPSVGVLLARSIPVLRRQRSFQALNARYEYRDWLPSEAPREVEICSGCFLLGSRSFWLSTGGFDERYFLYFEDFDLCMRARRHGWRPLCDSSVLVRHAGGAAGRKGWRHAAWFIRSAWLFFRTWGWQIWRVGSEVTP